MKISRRFGGAWDAAELGKPDVPDELLDTVRRFLEQAGIAGGRMVVACSGGPDSLTLAHAMVQVVPARTMELTLAHFNHQLRGAASDADEEAVVAFGQSHGVPVERTRQDVALATADKRGNLEAEARALRYAWLSSVATKTQSTWVATGHTANDQAETVLHNLVRGTGLRGLRGIARKRRLADGIELVRPLLDVTRDQVLAYLAESQLVPRHDATNDDLRRTRNRLRHELLPLLRRDYNARVDAALARLADQVQDYWPEHEQQVHAHLQLAERQRVGGVVVLGIPELARLPARLLSDVFYLVWERENWPRQEMTHAFWQALVDLVHGERGGRDLPGGVRAQRRGDVLTLERRQPQS